MSFPADVKLYDVRFVAPSEVQPDDVVVVDPAEIERIELDLRRAYRRVDYPYVSKSEALVDEVKKFREELVRAMRSPIRTVLIKRPVR